MAKRQAQGCSECWQWAPTIQLDATLSRLQVTDERLHAPYELASVSDDFDAVRLLLDDLAP